jgi:hypothetical protein
MKKNFLILILIGALTAHLGCSKDPVIVSKTVVESYPSITLNGNEVVVLAPGQTFVDAGATVSPAYNSSGALDTTAAANLSIKADSVVIGTAEGIYFVPYTYRNYYGFETTIQRKVVIVSQAYTSNYAGKWKRTTGIIANWTNLGSGVHAIKDPGGANLTGDFLYVIIKNDNSVLVPPQTMASGAVITGLNNISFTPTQVKYAFRAGNGVYGTAVRTFDKQP